MTTFPFTPRRQQGFAYIAAIVLLVVMAAMAATMVRLNTVQATNTGMELQGIRAGLAARAGIEWGLHQVRDNPCIGATAVQSRPTVTLTDLVADTGFRVTVNIECRPFREGESTEGAAFGKIVYEISAVACNGGSVCPADAATVAGADYVERRRTASACITAVAGRPDCYGE